MILKQVDGWACPNLKLGRDEGDGGIRKDPHLPSTAENNYDVSTCCTKSVCCSLMVCNFQIEKTVQAR